MSRSDLSPFVAVPNLRVNISCDAFVPVRRNPEGGPPALSKDQEEALAKLLNLIVGRDRSKRTVLVLTGYAGTGKTTVMKVLKSNLEKAGVEVKLVAPTNKAAVRLSQATGAKTGTVHSLLYGAGKQKGVCPQCGTVSPELGLSPVMLERQGLDGWTCPKCDLFVPIDSIKLLDQGPHYDDKKKEKVEAFGPGVIIVDEASMVGTKLARDLEANAAGKRWAVLYVGDKGQLPPVGEAWGADFEHPTAELTKVHRQKGESPILDLATKLRNITPAELKQGVDPFEDVPQNKELRVYPASLKEAANWLANCRKERKDATLISFTNKARRSLNYEVRLLRGLVAESRKTRRRLVHADRVLVLANNNQAKTVNGEVLIVEDSWFPEGGLRELGMIWVKLWKRGKFLIMQDTIDADNLDQNGWKDIFSPYTDPYVKAEGIIRDVESDDPRGNYSRREVQKARMVTDEELTAEERFDKFQAIAPRDLLFVDYGECITGHKSQGSQWKDVGVIWDFSAKRLFNEGTSRDPLEGVRWLYTVVTRTSQNLIVFEV